MVWVDIPGWEDTLTWVDTDWRVDTMGWEDTFTWVDTDWRVDTHWWVDTMGWDGTEQGVTGRGVRGRLPAHACWRDHIMRPRRPLVAQTP
ncbi:hypothetical protein GCM10022226_30200 [Sphaerisporangium flaviroseum]|uniref:Uncharacterized protein n=1 Tax=Sphaerisporangium flaviroseum TaxID=509199 RepID=A0ABP7I6F5_9ACTN